MQWNKHEFIIVIIFLVIFILMLKIKLLYLNRYHNRNPRNLQCKLPLTPRYLFNIPRDYLPIELPMWERIELALKASCFQIFNWNRAFPLISFSFLFTSQLCRKLMQFLHAIWCIFDARIWILLFKSISKKSLSFQLFVRHTWWHWK